MAESLEGKALDRDTLNLASMVRKLYESPKSRDLLLNAIRAADPNVPIPELEQAQSIADAKKQSADEVQKLRDEIEQERAQRKLDELRNAPVSQGLIKEEEQDDLDKFMADNQFAITQRVQAAKLYSLSRKAAEPRDAPPPPRKVEDEAGLWANPNKWAKQRAYEALQEMRKQA